jgi:hypothetical protein
MVLNNTKQYTLFLIFYTCNPRTQPCDKPQLPKRLAPSESILHTEIASETMLSTSNCLHSLKQGASRLGLPLSESELQKAKLVARRWNRKAK